MRWLSVLFAICVPALAHAQSGTIERLLEQQLSSDGRTVEIDGFTGALSARATIETIRVSDENGEVWLELNDIVLDWTRSALLRGRLEVQELSAARITLTELPAGDSGSSTPNAEASGFRIPDLPVSIQLDRVAAEVISVGPSVLGEPVEATLSLSASLANGALDLSLDAERIDAQSGQAQIALAYDPVAETFLVDLDVSEPPGGVVAKALSLPGGPSLSLRAQGQGPLDDFVADIALATEGNDRFSGQVRIAANETGRAFEADISGDIRPLLDPASHAFFGPETALIIEGQAASSGALALDQLTLRSDQLALDGEVALAPGGAPERIALVGRLGGTEPAVIPGTEVAIADADIRVGYDASLSDVWSFDGLARQVRAPGAAINSLSLVGEGRLNPSASEPLSGDIIARVAGVSLEDVGLAEAIGEEFELMTSISVADTGALAFEDLSFASATLSAIGGARVVPTDGRAAAEVELAVSAPDLGPFSTLAGLPLEGMLAADISAQAELPGGTVALQLDGRSADIGLGIAQLDPILRPESTLSLALRRDEAGSRIEAFELINPEVTALANGAMTGGGGALEVSAALRDIGLFTDLAEGGAVVTASLSDLTGQQNLRAALTSEFGASVSLVGPLAGNAPGLSIAGSIEAIDRFVPQLRGDASLQARLGLQPGAPEITAFASAEPGVAARLKGPVTGPDQAFEVLAKIANLGDFVSPLPGPARLSGTVRQATSAPDLDLTLTASPGIITEITGRPTVDEEGVTITSQLRDLGAFVPQLAGPAELTVRVTEITADPLINAQMQATPGLAARVIGRPTVADDTITLDATARDLGFLSPQLSGSARVTAALSDLSGRQAVRAQIESATGLSGQVSGQLAEPNARLDFNARLAALSRFVDGLRGGAAASGSLTDLRGSPNITAELQTDTGARADVTAEVGLPNGRVDVAAVGDLPLAVAEPFLGERSVDGRARFDLTLRGAPVLGSLAGRIETQGARAFDPSAGITLSPIDATLDLSGGRAEISARTVLEGATITIDGSAGLSAPFPIDLATRGTRVPIRFQELLENETSFDLTLRGPSPQSMTIAGGIRIEDTEVRIPDTGLGFSPDIPPIRHDGAPATVQRTLDRAGLSIDGLVAEANGASVALPLDLTLTALTPVFVRGRGIDAGFDGGFGIGGTTADPILTGGLELTRGRLDFLGRRFDVDEGRIFVAGSLTPRIDLVARTQVEDVSAEVSVAGPVTEPELSLSSAPQLPEDEILARILFGRGIETLSAFQIARLVASVRQLSGGGNVGVLENTRRSLGVDDVDLRTDDTTGEAALAIGQTLDEGLYSEVEVGSGGTTTFSLNFDVTDTTTIRGSASSDGETGIGIFWERDY